MLYASFWTRLLTALFGRRCSASHPRPRRRAVVPCLEVLEDRLTPSTLTVTTNADSGLGSLRYEITHAANGDSIVFAQNVHAITLTSGELDISKNLNISGPGANKLTISGNDASRVFDISAPVTVTLAGLKVADGLSSGQLLESQVGEYQPDPMVPATGAGGGGGILNVYGASSSLTNDTVCDNTALGTVGFTVVGGGLLNLGTATVVDCTFTNNHVTGGGAFDAIGGSGGAAIDSFGGIAGGLGTGSELTVTGSTFYKNTATAAGENSYFGLGGGIEVDGGLNAFDFTQLHPSSATITDSTIVDNTATGGPDALANGGGLCIFGNSIVTLIDCTIAGNLSKGGGGGNSIATGDSEAVGGGVYNALGTLNVMDCTITGNEAIGGNNAVISDADPYAGGAFGGGIQNNVGGVLNISNSWVADNIAQGGVTSAGPGSSAFGGGIENSTIFLDGLNSAAKLTVTNCVVADNSAVAGHGGSGPNSNLVSAQAGFAFGGGIDSSHNGSSAVVCDSLIAGNSAIGSAGGSGNNGGNAYGGGLAVGWATLFDQPEGSQLTLRNSLVTDNVAQGGAGGAGADGGSGLGGGLVVTGSSSAATVMDSLIEYNDATAGQKGSGGTSAGQGIGGGVYNDLGLFTKVLTDISHNRASTNHNNIFPA